MRAKTRARRSSPFNSVTNREPLPDSHFTIFAATSGLIQYEFTTDQEPSKVVAGTLNSETQHVGANSVNDEIVDNGDGTWTVTGEVANWHGDTYVVQGNITSFNLINQDGPVFLVHDRVDVTSQYLGSGGAGGGDTGGTDDGTNDGSDGGDPTSPGPEPLPGGVTRKQAAVGAVALLGVGYVASQ